MCVNITYEFFSPHMPLLYISESFNAVFFLLLSLNVPVISLLYDFGLHFV